MTVTELIEKLLDMPQEAEIRLITYSDESNSYDTSEIEGIYLSKKAEVLIHEGYHSLDDMLPIDQPNPIQP